MECIAVTEVPPCIDEELMVDLIKGQIRRVIEPPPPPSFDIGCVTVLSFWGVGGFAVGVTICSSSDGLASASSSSSGRESEAERTGASGATEDCDRAVFVSHL